MAEKLLCWWQNLQEIHSIECQEKLFTRRHLIRNSDYKTVWWGCWQKLLALSGDRCCELKEPGHEETMSSAGEAAWGAIWGLQRSSPKPGSKIFSPAMSLHYPWLTKHHGSWQRKITFKGPRFIFTGQAKRMNLVLKGNKLITWESPFCSSSFVQVHKDQSFLATLWIIGHHFLSLYIRKMTDVFFIVCSLTFKAAGI